MQQLWVGLAHVVHPKCPITHPPQSLCQAQNRSPISNGQQQNSDSVAHCYTFYCGLGIRFLRIPELGWVLVCGAFLVLRCIGAHCQVTVVDCGLVVVIMLLLAACSQLCTLHDAAPSLCTLLLRLVMVHNDGAN